MLFIDESFNYMLFINQSFCLILFIDELFEIMMQEEEEEDDDDLDAESALLNNNGQLEGEEVRMYYLLTYKNCSVLDSTILHHIALH